jgi:hypothetical protein
VLSSYFHMKLLSSRLSLIDFVAKVMMSVVSELRFYHILKFYIFNKYVLKLLFFKTIQLKPLNRTDN